MQTNLEIIQTVTKYKPFREFDIVEILENEKGFRIHVQFCREYGQASFLIFENCVVGGFEYLGNYNKYEEKIVEYFETMEECVNELFEITVSKINEMLDKTEKVYNVRKTFGFKNVVDIESKIEELQEMLNKYR